MSDLIEPLELSAVEFRLAKAYADLGTTYYNQHQYDDAIAYFGQALESTHLTAFEQATLHSNIGLALVRQGKFDEALQSFDQALQLNPHHHKTQFHIQRIEYERQNQQRGYQFSQDWFSRNLLIWQEVLSRFVGQPHCQALEIGSWEGRSACWLLDHVLTHDTARLTCIDTFRGGQEHRLRLPESVLQSVETVFDQNIQTSGLAHKVDKRVGRSQDILRSLPVEHYDFIYIDGSHRASDVLTDAVLSWALLKPSGLLLFDDYDFDQQDPLQNTKTAINAFLTCFDDQLMRLHQSHQVIVEKRPQPLE